MTWEPGLYDAVHSYVSSYGKDLVEVLAPKTGERILDLGCGTGTLTGEIARSGAIVTGIDSSPEMIGQARQNYPRLDFRLVDARTFRSADRFDAVFSNAALHWIQPPEDVAKTIREALKPAGRFIAEFGGKGNVRSIVEAAGFNPWYYPSIGEYAALLEQNGFEVTSAVLFDRPTTLEGEPGLREWLGMFFKPQLPATEVTRIESELRPKLYRDGSWIIDYKRLRITAHHTEPRP
ncbi:MAG: class I SAM-dependent methyltransferase [Bryobacteraceae bacterium]